MLLVAVHPALREMVAERLSPYGTYAGVEVRLVDRPPGDIALDCAEPCSGFCLPGDVVILAASEPRLAGLAASAAPDYDCRLRPATTEVDAPLAQAIADGGGLGLAVVGRDLRDDDVFVGANALTALLGGILSRMDRVER